MGSQMIVTRKIKSQTILPKYYEIIVPGLPVTALRARSTNGGRHYTPEAYRAYKLKVANAIKGKFANEIQALAAYPERAKAVRYALLVLANIPKDRGDWDNYAKAVQDALQDSGLIHDDKQVAFGFCGKVIRPTPSIEICLFELPSAWALPAVAVGVFRFAKYFLCGYKPGIHLGMLAAGFALWQGMEYQGEDHDANG